MKLLTKELEKQFPKLYANENKQPEDIKVIAKFFDPTGSWTWYATEYEPESKTFFGYVQGNFGELGYFYLDELESIRGALGLGIERDLYFSDKTLADVMR